MEDNFEPPAVIIEEIQEVAETPEEQASRAFVNIFYSLLHNIQNGKKGGVETLYQQRVKKMASFFHSEAWVSLQGKVIRGIDTIIFELVSNGGYYFEPKLISVQPTLPDGSMLILTTGIARLVKQSRETESMEFEGSFEERHIWKKFTFSQFFLLIPPRLLMNGLFDPNLQAHPTQSQPQYQQQYQQTEQQYQKRPYYNNGGHRNYPNKRGRKSHRSQYNQNAASEYDWYSYSFVADPWAKLIRDHETKNV